MEKPKENRGEGSMETKEIIAKKQNCLITHTKKKKDLVVKRKIKFIV